MTKIEFENSVVRLALESGLNLGTVLKALSEIQWRFMQAKDRLANEADVSKAAEFGKLIINQDDHAPA